MPLFPASNQFPNQSETQITQSNLIHCCLSATQPFGERCSPTVAYLLNQAKTTNIMPFAV
ncbi:MAG: hypothetical protein LBG58_13560 [Planctomycetaceae bacterium]|nr:hypothetical protein [Planctomycetaceae bacterium]